VVGNEIDAVTLRRARLHAVIAEELAGRAHRFGRPAGRDFGDDLVVAGQRDLIPELAHHVGRLAEADRRAYLRGVAAIAGRQLHVDDVALPQDAAGRAWVAEDQSRVRHRRRADDEEVNVAAPIHDGGARRGAQFVFFRTRLGARDHRFHRALAQNARLAHAVELFRAMDDDEVVQEAFGENEFGVRQARAQGIVLIDRHIVFVPWIDLHQPDTAAI